MNGVSSSMHCGLTVLVPSALAQQLDVQAIALRAQVKPEVPDDLKAISQANFQSTILRGVIHIDGREHPTHRVKTILNREGQETSRYFAHEENDQEWVGFAGEAFDEFLALCHELHAVEEINQVISFTFLVEAAFEWFHRMYGQAHIPQTFEFTTAILAFCEPEVQMLEVWIPVEGMEFDSTFRLGQVEFKNVSAQEFENWLHQWGARWPEQNHPDSERVGRVFGEIEARFQNKFPIAAVQLRAEPVRAVERTLDEVDRTLGLLRFFSHANFHPTSLSHCTVEGTLPSAKPRYILLRNRVLTSSGLASQEWPNFPLERFNALELTKMREVGLDTLNGLLQLEPNQRTPYERQLLKALEIYSKASLTRNVSDKLLYIVVSLESMFIQGKEGLLRKRVAERLAFMLGDSLQQRHAIIEIYSAAYEARSNAVHRGEEPHDRAMLKEFLNLAWHAFRSLIENPKQHKSQKDLLDDLDETKFR